MPIQERVTSYSVTELRNSLVNYRHVVRLTTESGHQAFLAFPEVPPDNWLTISGPSSTVFLEQREFDHVHRLLQTESPIFYTAFNLIGSAFNLSTTAELPGEGPADDDVLRELATQLRGELSGSRAT